MRGDFVSEGAVVSCRTHERELPSTKPPPPALVYPARLPKLAHLPSGLFSLLGLMPSGGVTPVEFDAAYRAVQEADFDANNATEAPCAGLQASF